MLTMTSALCLAPDEKGFRFALTIAAFAVLGLSYAGVVLMPSAPSIARPWKRRISGSGGASTPTRTWRGRSWPSLCFAALYLMRSGQWVTGLAIAVLSAFFVLKTGSKTTFGLMPIVAVLVLGGASSAVAACPRGPEPRAPRQVS